MTAILYFTLIHKSKQDANRKYLSICYFELKNKAILHEIIILSEVFAVTKKFCVFPLRQRNLNILDNYIWTIICEELCFYIYLYSINFENITYGIYFPCQPGHPCGQKLKRSRKTVEDLNCSYLSTLSNIARCIRCWHQYSGQNPKSIKIKT